MSFVNDLENAVLDALLGASATLLGGSVDIALSTTDPGEDGSGITEPSGGAYARVTVTNNGTNFPAAASGEKSNGAAITFPSATGDWGTISHWALYDSGTLKIYGELDDGAGTPTTREVLSGDVFSFPVGQLRITLD